MQTIMHALIIGIAICTTAATVRPFFAIFRIADRRRVAQEVAYVQAFHSLNAFERFLWPVPIGTPAANTFGVLLASLIASGATGWAVYMILCVKMLGG